MNRHQNQFQNAGQNGSFTSDFYSVNNPTPIVLLILLTNLVTLAALLLSEARYRALLERLSGVKAE